MLNLVRFHTLNLGVVKIQKDVGETAARNVINAIMDWLKNAHQNLKQLKVYSKCFVYKFFLLFILILFIMFDFLISD